MELLPRSEAARRVSLLQKWMQASSVDAVFILQNVDLYFFAGTIQSGVLCVPLEGEPVYLVKKSACRAVDEAAWHRVLRFSRLEEVPRILASHKFPPVRRLGLETDVLPTSFYLRFAELFPEARMVDASEAILGIRAIKSAYEISQIRKAAEMLMAAWGELPRWIRAGATELEALAQVEQYLRRKGHQGIQRTRRFNSEIGFGAFSAGPNACFPTSFPGSTGFAGLYPAVSNAGNHRPLVAGEPILVDVCGGYGGYIADAARTAVIGSLPPDMQDAHAWVLELTRKIEFMLKPGTTCGAICDMAFDMADRGPYGELFMGCGDNRMRYVGHGVGLELDEPPVLASGNGTRLEAGMVLAVEPKVFFPGRGGVGIENVYLLTQDGFEKITRFPEDIIYC